MAFYQEDVYENHASQDWAGSPQDDTNHSHIIAGIADAAIVWLMHAPCLTHVRWGVALPFHHEQAANMTDWKLAALTSSCSIKCLDATGKAGDMTQAKERLH